MGLQILRRPATMIVWVLWITTELTQDVTRYDDDTMTIRQTKHVSIKGCVASGGKQHQMRRMWER